MTELSINALQTLAIGVLALLCGDFLKKKIRIFETFCIPAPVMRMGLYFPKERI